MKKIYLLISLILIVLLGACNVDQNPQTDDDLYDLTFIVDNAVYHTYKVNIGDTIIFPSDPIKTGYSFDGWYVNDTKFTATIVFYSALTLTARFVETPEVITYTVSFYDATTLIQTVLIEQNKPLTGKYPSTNKEGFTFKGWYLDALLTIPHSPISPVISDLNLYGKWEASVTPDISFTGYYQTLNDQSGDDLYQALETLLQTRSLTSYGEVRYLLEESDLAIGSTNRLWLIYDGALVLNTWDGGVSFDREHVWPVSLLGVPRPDNSTKNISSDSHNLRASTPSVNGARGNKVFAEGSGTHKAVSGGYYPGDQHKGDVARIILYMHIAWDIEINVGNFEMFLRWHEEDPVDQFEINRNNVIYSYQNNRNVFIDHPSITEYLWPQTNLTTQLEFNYHHLTFLSI